MTRRIFISLFLALILSVGDRPAAADEPGDVFRLTAVEGAVGVIPAGGRFAVPVEAGFPLEPGDRIMTKSGGRAEIAMSNGTVIELQAETDFEIETVEGAFNGFFLRAGRFFSSFSRLKEAISRDRRPVYQIRTVVAVGSVRGTELVMGIDAAGVLEAGVLEGEVDFSPAVEGGESGWTEPVRIGGDRKGLRVEPSRPPNVLRDLPPIAVPALRRMKHIRERVKRHRVEWKPASRGALRAIRRRTLEREVDFQRPGRPEPEKVRPERRRRERRRR